MNLVCPHCQQMLTILDQFAGQAVKCPLCGNTFGAPTLAPTAVGGPPPTTTPAPLPPATPEIAAAPLVPAKEDIYSFAAGPQQPPPYPLPRLDEPAPDKGKPAFTPPGGASARGARPGEHATSPLPPELPSPGTPLPGTLTPGAYAHTSTIWISPKVVPWIAPVALSLLFVMLFFSWVGMPGDAEFYQTGWGTGFGKHLHALGLFHVLFFLFAFLAMAAGLILERTQVNLPSTVRQVWPWRPAIVGGLALVAFVFLVLELVVGFGLEQRATNPANEPPMIAKLVSVGVPADAAYDVVLHRTFWLRIAVLAHVTALIGAGLTVWLMARGSRPLPRIDISR